VNQDNVQRKRANEIDDKSLVGLRGVVKISHLILKTKNRIPVIEQAIETATLTLGTDKSRGYCLEMICADFLAGANLDNGNPDVLLDAVVRFYRFLPGEHKDAFLHYVGEKAAS
jgi:hypothetical protein